MLVTTLGENSFSSFDLFRVTTIKQMLVTTLGENVVRNQVISILI
jgi:hypothetical protein